MGCSRLAHCPLLKAHTNDALVVHIHAMKLCFFVVGVNNRLTSPCGLDVIGEVVALEILGDIRKLRDHTFELLVNLVPN